jgi:hypothetical protein
MAVPHEVPAATPVGLESQATGRPWDPLVAFVRRMVSPARIGGPHAPLSSEAPRTARNGAATEVALAQRITGPGSGPYSGTPFLVAPRTTGDAKQPPALDEPCEAARHDHGIIDHSRHVSSIGRR